MSKSLPSFVGISSSTIGATAHAQLRSYNSITSGTKYKKMNEDPEIEYSKYSQKINSGGKILSIDIYRSKGMEGWILEIVDKSGNSTVWDDLFESDIAAITEARKSILEETADTFVGPSDGKSDGKWR